MYTLLLIAIVLQQIADGVSTYLALTEYNGREINPMMQYLMHHIGLVPTLLVTKLGFAGVVVYAQPQEWVLWALVGIYSLVLWHNGASLYAAEKKRRITLAGK